MIACFLLLITGCADFSLFSLPAQPSLFDARRDGPGLPMYLDKRQSVLVVEGTRTRVLNACRDALLILGCSKIHEDGNTFQADRTFIPGFVCGVGGESFHVTADQLAENRYLVRIVSYKGFPYPAAPRFLDRDFSDIIVQLLSDTIYDSTL